MPTRAPSCIASSPRRASWGARPRSSSSPRSTARTPSCWTWTSWTSPASPASPAFAYDPETDECRLLGFDIGRTYIEHGWDPTREIPCTPDGVGLSPDSALIVDWKSGRRAGDAGGEEPADEDRRALREPLLPAHPRRDADRPHPRAQGEALARARGDRRPGAGRVAARAARRQEALGRRAGSVGPRGAAQRRGRQPLPLLPLRDLLPRRGRRDHQVPRADRRALGRDGQARQGPPRRPEAPAHHCAHPRDRAGGPAPPRAPPGRARSRGTAPCETTQRSPPSPWRTGACGAPAR
jgi:hypothetical protein